MADSPYLLQFADVTVEDEAHDYDVGLAEVSVALRPGELAVVLLERPRFRTPLADVASGIVEPDRGRVLLQGRDWCHTLATRASRMRSQIGRIFDGRAWVSNLDVDENVLLPQSHHSSRSPAELEHDAQALARHFGLPELPTIRPARASPDELHRSACVRAFLGDPELLLLERPEHGLFPAIVAPLIAAVDAARERGAAGIWLTNLPEIFNDPALRPTARFRMDGPALRPVDAER
jgi:phospholipid/cholesterol/gamma-HCH transport system ATP-binding protein